MFNRKKSNGIGIVSTGHQLPDNIQTNEELCLYMKDKDPNWIVEKTGIKKRYIARKEDSASSFSLSACKKAIKKTNISVKDINLIIACTFSHDYQFPPLSAKIQKELHAKNAQVFDLQANCAGFITGLSVAVDRMTCDPSIKYALVIGVELHTRYTNPKNIETSMFLSDGAGAAILGRVANDRGYLTSHFFADTSTYEAVRLRGGGSSFTFDGRKFNPDTDFMEMNGIATWKQAITNLPISIRNVCEKANINLEEIDFVLFHQANLNLINYLMQKLKINLNKTITNVENIGNTGSASLAIVLDEALTENKIRENDKVLLAAVGAGYIYGSSIWIW